MRGPGRGAGSRPLGGRARRDWTQGSILGSLWGLSWPIMVSQTLNMLGPTIDMIWIGKLGSRSMAGVGIASMIVMLVNSLNQGLYQGLRAMIARFIGAGDEESANRVTQQSLIISAGFSMVMAVIGIFFAAPLLQVFGLAPDVVSEGAAYIKIQFIGTVTMTARLVSEAAMQSSGDAMTPMRIALVFRFVHLALDPFLIFGWWIFPRMGVSGAALTGIISQATAGGLGLWVMFRGHTRLKLSLRNFRFDPDLIWRQVKVGLPASVNGMERTFAQLVLVWFVAPFGTVATAAHTMQQRVDQFVHLPAMGWGQGASVLTGQNLGAGKPERAERTAWLAVGLTTGMMVIVSVLMWFWAEYLVRIFNTEPELVKISAAFVRINIVNYLGFGLMQILMQCLNGVGETVIPMITTMVTMWGIQVPLAYILPHYTSLGVYGVRWAMVIAFALRGIVYVVYFRSGRWKRKKI
ncbi:MAG: MATE family efflux transporter [Chloroflexi bacterium]|nr:MATE family efflux transporter [Chloroflexota bacterium]